MRHVNQYGKNNIQHALYTSELPCNNIDGIDIII